MKNSTHLNDPLTANNREVEDSLHRKGDELECQIQWLALVLGLVVSVAGSMGCATMAATEAAGHMGEGGGSDPKLVLEDEVVAIGRPDAALAKKLGQEHVVAFIGLKKTYLLNKGGEDLERIAQLKLDGRRMEVHADEERLYLKDKQIWGDLVLVYGDPKPISSEEQAELVKGGFSQDIGLKSIYSKRVHIEGVVCPAIKLSDEQMEKLTTHRNFKLYNPGDAKPPVMSTILAKGVGAPLIIVAGVATDIALIPVYGILVIGAAF